MKSITLHHNTEDNQRVTDFLDEPPASIRTSPADFEVEEQLGFELEGQGEHLWLWIEKEGVNTAWVAENLARFAACSPREVGVSGLKDRHAIARQWFSVPVKKLDLQRLEKGMVLGDTGQAGRITLLSWALHSRKLRRGTHRANRFKIRVRDIHSDRSLLEARLHRIATTGVPNYFGEQRFGHNGENVNRCLALAGEAGNGDKRKGKKLSRNKRSLYLSAGRSWLFNQVLSQRVQQRTWNQALPGDLMQLSGSRSHFLAETVDAEIHNRVNQMDIHPTGPLWGRDKPATRGAVAEEEQAVAGQWSELVAILEREGLKQERRSLRLEIEQLEWQFLDTDLELRFDLVAGGFATALLRELLPCLDAQRSW